MWFVQPGERRRRVCPTRCIHLGPPASLYANIIFYDSTSFTHPPAHIDWMATQLDRALASKPKDVAVTILVYVTSASSPSHSHHAHTHSDHSHSPTSTVKGSLRSPSPTSPTSPTTLCEKSLDDEKTGVPTLEKHDRVLSTYSTTSDPEACTEAVGSDVARAGEWEEKGVEIRWGRPDIHGLLEETVTTSEGAVSVDGMCFLWWDVR